MVEFVCESCGETVKLLPLMAGERPFNTPYKTDYAVCPNCEAIYVRVTHVESKWKKLIVQEEVIMIEEICMNCKHSDNDLGFVSYRCQLIYDEALADEEHDMEWYDFAKVRSYHACHYEPSKFEPRDSLEKQRCENMSKKDALVELFLGEIAAQVLMWKHDDITGKQFIDKVESILLKFKSKAFTRFFQAMDE